MLIKDLINELKSYDPKTRIDFIVLDKDWEDSTKDTYVNFKGVVGSGEDSKKYIEIGLEIWTFKNSIWLCIGKIAY